MSLSALSYLERTIKREKNRIMKEEMYKFPIRYPYMRGWTGPEVYSFSELCRYSRREEFSDFDRTFEITINTADFTAEATVICGWNLTRISVDWLPPDKVNEAWAARMMRALVARADQKQKVRDRISKMDMNTRNQVTKASFRSDTAYKIRDKHNLFMNKLKIMHEKAMHKYGEDSEYARAWLRIRRCVMRDPSLIAYSEDEIECMSGKISWSRYPHKPFGNRVRGKFSKMMSRMGVPNHVVGNIAQDWVAEHTDKLEFNIIKGDKVRQAYADSIGCHSCMTTADGEFVTMYSENPDKVQMVVCNIDGTPSGRAILWTLDDDEGLYLDRPYPQSDRMFAFYRKWTDDMKSKGYKIYTYDLHNLPSYATCTVNIPENHSFPYMDSFSGYDVDEGKGQYIVRASGGKYDATPQDGGVFMENNRTYCVYCDEPITGEEYQVGMFEFVCHYCYEEYYTYCDACMTTILQEDAYGISGYTYCESCFDDNTFICEDCNKTKLTMNLNRVVTSDMNRDICEECSDNYTRCYECDAYQSNEDMQENDLGQLVCSMCKEDS